LRLVDAMVRGVGPGQACCAVGGHPSCRSEETERPRSPAWSPRPRDLVRDPVASAFARYSVIRTPSSARRGRPGMPIHGHIWHGNVTGRAFTGRMVTGSRADVNRACSSGRRLAPRSRFMRDTTLDSGRGVTAVAPTRRGCLGPPCLDDPTPMEPLAASSTHDLDRTTTRGPYVSAAQPRHAWRRAPHAVGPG